MQIEDVWIDGIWNQRKKLSYLKKSNKINIKKAQIFRLGLFEFGAGNETRTRDPNLGKVVLYQLSYSRVLSSFYKNLQ